MARRKKEKQKPCPEDAGLWTKLHNEPYLRTHPGMFVLALLWSFLTSLAWFGLILVVFGYVIVNIKLWPLL